MPKIFAWLLTPWLWMALTLPALATGPIPAEKMLLLDLPGQPVAALEFTGKTMAGKTVRLSEFKGQVVFINFWATWCVPCLLEMPSMDKLNRKMAGKRFKMIAVNQAEEPERVRKFATDKNFSFDLVLDPAGKISGDYGINRLPLTYIIDPAGNVARRAIGAREWDQAIVVELLEHLMGPGGDAGQGDGVKAAGVSKE